MSYTAVLVSGFSFYSVAFLFIFRLKSNQHFMSIYLLICNSLILSGQLGIIKSLAFPDDFQKKKDNTPQSSDVSKKPVSPEGSSCAFSLLFSALSEPFSTADPIAVLSTTPCWEPVLTTSSCCSLSVSSWLDMWLIRSCLSVATEKHTEMSRLRGLQWIQDNFNGFIVGF